MYEDYPDLRFIIRQDVFVHHFFQSENVSSHLVLENGNPGHIYVCFPSGNSGVTLSLYPSGNDSKEVEILLSGETTEFSMNRKDHGISFVILSNQKSLTMSDIYMDNIKFIRSLKYPPSVFRRIEERKQALQLMGSPEEGHIKPLMSLEEGLQDSFAGTINFKKHTIDNKHTYYLQLSFSDKIQATVEGEKIQFSSIDGNFVILKIAVSTDFDPLVPLRRHELISNGCLEFLSKLEKKNPFFGEKLDKSLKSLRFLSYRQKFLAGSWRFLTYFGRDTMISLMMLKNCLTPEAYQDGMQSVLDRMSPIGAVAHEEDIGCQAIDRRLPEYIRLKEEGSSVEADELLKNMDSPVYDYKMMDDDFLFPIMLKLFLMDDSIHSVVKRSFLKKVNHNGEKNLETALKSLNYILEKSYQFAESENPKDLIRIKPGEYVGNWRDSTAGLGWGVYPGDINSFLVPECLNSIKTIVYSPVFSSYEINHIAQIYKLDFLQSIIQNPKKFDKIIKSWQSAKNHFLVRIDAGMMRKRLKDFLDNHPGENGEREYILQRKLYNGITFNDFIFHAKIPETIRDGVEFYALSLNEDGTPVEVINSDVAFYLFFGNPDPEEIKRILKIITFPYPAGLQERSGILVANPAFSSNKSLWKSLDRNAYHGAVVWSWHNSMLKMGLMRQIRRFCGIPGHDNLVLEMFLALGSLLIIEKIARDLVNTELWTHRFEDGKFEPVPFFYESGCETSSNPVQLWSCAIIAVTREYHEVEEIISCDQRRMHIIKVLGTPES